MLSIGLHDSVPHDEYHADPASRPSLSPHVAMVLLAKSPAHAALCHPRLGGVISSGSSDAMDTGTVIHGMLLGGGPAIVEVDAKDWRTNAAKEEREAAEKAGKVAILRHRMDAIREAGHKIRDSIPFSFGSTRCEVTAIWEDEECLCRCRIDSLDDSVIRDLKTTDDAAMASAARNIIAHGYHIQAAANIEAIETLCPELAGRVSFFDVFAETAPPYGVIVAEMAGTMLELGRRRWKRAKTIWKQCLAANNWPSYAAEVVRIEAPAWAMSDEMDKSLSSAGAAPF